MVEAVREDGYGRQPPVRKSPLSGEYSDAHMGSF